MAKPLTFGKYKGRTIAEVLTGDPEYLQWLCAQAEFRSAFMDTYRDILDCVEDSIDAPMRKAMRARFQDVDFRRRFLRASGHEAILVHKLEVKHARTLGELADRLRSLEEATSEAKNHTDDPGHQAWAQANGIFTDHADRERQLVGFEQMITALHGLRKRIPSQIKAPELKTSCRFEQRGFDVVVQASIRYPWGSELRKNYLGSHDDESKSTIAIKIRGTVGSNYPRTVQWVNNNRTISFAGSRAPRAIADHVVLLVGRYTGNHETKEQFVNGAAAADIKIVFADDL